MTANIENNLVVFSNNIYNTELFMEFNLILDLITTSFNEASLRDGMKKYFDHNAKYFEYGFGGSHMWVKQRKNVDGCSETLDLNITNRIIFVPFQN